MLRCTAGNSRSGVMSHAIHGGGRGCGGEPRPNGCHRPHRPAAALYLRRAGAPDPDLGPLAALRTPTDIFPDIRIPVIARSGQYTGLPPDEMAGRIVTHFERALTTTVNDIEHIEAKSCTGIGIVKIFFQPGVDIRTANAQVTSISQTRAASRCRRASRRR